jgi:ABC-type multidrug transport system fused ATPase/permease subunit
MVETKMTSMERLTDYIQNNPSEKDFKAPQPPKLWPTDGKICLTNFCLRYRPNLENVIHKLSLTIEPHEKVTKTNF